MKKVARIVVALAVTIFYQSLCYAQPGGIERKQLFDYSWKFYLGDIPAAKTNDFNDKDWRNLNLPHDWSIEGKINPRNPTGLRQGHNTREK